MFNDITIDVPGFRIAAKTYGTQNPDADVVICLHGMLDNAASFDRLLPLLNKKNAFYISFDLPGVGYSSHYSIGIVPSFMNDAFLILKAIKVLGLSRVNIIAHSYGSLIGTVIALARSPLVIKMVFLDVLGPKLSFSDNYLAIVQKNIETYGDDKLNEPTVFKSQEDALRERMKSGPISEEAAQILATRALVDTPAGWIWNYDRALHYLSSTLPNNAAVMTMLQALELPICLIRATNGISYPQEIFDERIRALRNCTVHTIAGGHHVHLEAPEKLAPIISGFLFDQIS